MQFLILAVWEHAVTAATQVSELGTERCPILYLCMLYMILSLKCESVCNYLIWFNALESLCFRSLKAFLALFIPGKGWSTDQTLPGTGESSRGMMTQKDVVREKTKMQTTPHFRGRKVLGMLPAELEHRYTQLQTMFRLKIINPYEC